MKTTLKITLLIGVCILGFLLLVPLVREYIREHVKQQNEKWEAEQLLESIVQAKQTGTLNLYPPFLFGSKDFHATKKFWERTFGGCSGIGTRLVFETDIFVRFP